MGEFFASRPAQSSSSSSSSSSGSKETPGLTGFEKKDPDEEDAPPISFQQLQRISYDLGRALGLSRLFTGSETLSQNAAVRVADSSANGLQLKEYRFFVRQDSKGQALPEETSEGKPKPGSAAGAVKGKKKKRRHKYKNRVFTKGGPLSAVLPSQAPSGIPRQRWYRVVQCLHGELDFEAPVATREQEEGAETTEEPKAKA